MSDDSNDRRSNRSTFWSLWGLYLYVAYVLFSAIDGLFIYAGDLGIFDRLTETVYSRVHPLIGDAHGLDSSWSHADLHFRAAYLRREAEEWGAAATEYKLGLRLEPDNDQARMGLGYVYLYQGEHDLAAEVLRPVVDRDPAQAYAAYGIIRANNRRQLRGDRFLAAYAKRVADQLDTVDELLRRLANEELDAEVTQLLELLIAERPRIEHYYARLYEWQLHHNEDPEAAEATARRAYEQLEPEDRGNAASNLGMSLGRRGEVAEALEYLEESARLLGDEFRYQDSLEYARQQVAEQAD